MDGADDVVDVRSVAFKQLLETGKVMFYNIFCFEANKDGDLARVCLLKTGGFLDEGIEGLGQVLRSKIALLRMSRRRNYRV